MIEIIVGGDVSPIGRNEEYFSQGDVSKLFGGSLSEFQKSDLAIVNLECPLIEDAKPISKAGPLLSSPSRCIRGLVDSGIDMVGLANNHIMDYGHTGLLNTIGVCNKNGIEVVGAGGNIAEARKIRIKNLNGFRVGVLAVAEHEFSIATKINSGANPVDLIDFIRNVNSTKENYDYLIVLYHGGNMNYPYPNPRLKETCQFMLENGANAVVVQHTHCPGCYSRHENGYIVYGQGNLLFDLPNRDKSFYKGMLIKLSIDNDKKEQFTLIPYEQSITGPGLRLLSGDVKQQFLATINERSEKIKDDAFVGSQWLAYCTNKKYRYLNRIYGINFLFRKLVLKKLFTRYLMNKRSMARLQNTISCESHREAILTILSNKMI